MSEEEYKSIIDLIDRKVIIKQTIKEPLDKSEQALVKLSVYCDDLRQEKQDLIKYLEDKIKEEMSITKLKLDKRKETLEEILDKVKGD